LGFTICTHTTSLSQDLTSDQKKLPKKQKKLSLGKKGRKHSEEQQRRIPLAGWTDAINGMCTVLKSYNTFNEYEKE